MTINIVAQHFGFASIAFIITILVIALAKNGEYVSDRRANNYLWFSFVVAVVAGIIF